MARTQAEIIAEAKAKLAAKAKPAAEVREEPVAPTPPVPTASTAPAKKVTAKKPAPPERPRTGMSLDQKAAADDPVGAMQEVISRAKSKPVRTGLGPGTGVLAEDEKPLAPDSWSLPTSTRMAPETARAMQGATDLVKGASAYEIAEWQRRKANRSGDRDGAKDAERTIHTIAEDVGKKQKYARDVAIREEARTFEKTALPDEKAVRLLSEEIMNGPLSTDRKVAAFLERRTAEILKRELDDPEKATPEEKQAARQKAAGEMTNARNKGWFAYAGTEADVLRSGGAGDIVRAVLPQREVSPTGRSSRSESLGWWAVNTLSIPEYLIVAGIAEDTDAAHAIARRTDLVSYALEKDEDLAADLASGDVKRINSGMSKLLPIMVASMAVPDPTMGVNVAVSGAKGSARLARITTRAAAELPSVKTVDDLRKAVDRAYEAEKITAAMRADRAAQARLGKATELYRSLGDAENVADRLDSIDPAVAKRVRDDVRTGLMSDPDVAAYLHANRKTTGRLDEWGDELPAKDIDAENTRIEAEMARVREEHAKRKAEANARREAEGRAPERGESLDADLEAELKRLKAQQKDLDHEAAARRGQEKIQRHYEDVSEKVFADLRSEARGEAVPTRDAAYYAPDYWAQRPRDPRIAKGADAATLVKRQLGVDIDAKLARRLAEAESPEDVVKILRNQPPEVQKAVAWAFGHTSYDDLKRTFEDGDDLTVQGNVGKARAQAAEKRRRVREAADLAAALRGAPQRAAEAAEARKKALAAEKAHQKALAALDRAGGSDLSKHTERVEKLRAKVAAAEKAAEEARRSFDMLPPEAPKKGPEWESLPAPQAAQQKARYGTPEEMAFDRVGEPYTLPDYVGEGPSARDLPLTERQAEWNRYKDRTANGVTKYLGNPNPEKLDPRHMLGVQSFARKAGFRPYNERVTPGKLWKAKRPNKAAKEAGESTAWERRELLGQIEDDADRVRAANPDRPTARSWNAYFRSLLPASDPLPDAPPREVMRVKDRVLVRDPDVARQVNPTLKHRGGGAGPMPFYGEVAGYTVGPDGKPKVRIRPMHVKDLGRPRFEVPETWAAKDVLVDPEMLRYYERGRYFIDADGPKGGKNPDFPRPYAPEDWKAIRAAEDADDSGLARSLRYGDDSVFVDVNPPRRASPDDFPVEPGMATRKEAVAIPKKGETKADVKGRVLAEKNATRAQEQHYAALDELERAEAQAKAYEDELLAAFEDAKDAEADARRALDAAQAEYQQIRQGAPKNVKAGLAHNEQVATAEDRVAALQKEVDALDARANELAGRIASRNNARRLLGRDATYWQGLADALEEADKALVKERQIANTRGPSATPPVKIDERLPGSAAAELAMLDRSIGKNKRNLVHDYAGKLYTRFVTGMSGAGSVLERSLAPKLREVMRVYVGEIGDIDSALALSTDGAKAGDDVNVRALDVADTYTDRFREAVQTKQADPTLLMLLATAYVQPRVQLVDDEVNALLKVVADWSRTDGDAAALRGALLAETRRLKGTPNQPEAVFRLPQDGDVIFAQNIAYTGAESDVLIRLGIDGLAVDAADHADANRWAAGIDPGGPYGGVEGASRGRQIVLRAMTDPDFYQPEMRVFAGPGQRGVADSTKTPFAPAKEGGRQAVDTLTAEAKLATQEAVAEMRRKLGAVSDRLAAVQGTEKYVPRAVRDMLAKQIDAAVKTSMVANEVGGANMLRNYWKQTIVNGLWLHNPFHFAADQFGDYGIVFAHFGAAKTARMVLKTATLPTLIGAAVGGAVGGIPGAVVGAGVGSLQNVATFPFAATVARLRDHFKGLDAGTTAAKWEQAFALQSLFSPEVAKILDRSDAEFKLPNGRTTTGKELHDVFSRARGFDTFVTQQLTRSVAQALADRGLGKASRVFVANERAVQYGANMVATRRRLALFSTLLDSGVDPDVAAQLTVKTLGDFQRELHPFERAWYFQLAFPFWTWTKFNTRRVFNAFFRPGQWGPGLATPGYRIKQFGQAQEYTAQTLSWYFDSSDEYGFDRNTMQEEPDPERLEELRDILRGEFPGESDVDIEKRLTDDPRYEKLPKAWVRYQQGLERVKGVPYRKVLEMVRAGDIPEWQGLEVYHAPDPTRESLPDYMQERYTVWVREVRSQAMASWFRKNAGRREESGDEMRFVPFPSDPNLQGIKQNLVFALVAQQMAEFPYRRLTDSKGTGINIEGVAEEQIRSATQNPIAGAVLYAAGLVEPGQTIDMKVPEKTGYLLSLIGLAKSREKQARGEDILRGPDGKRKTTYYVPAEYLPLLHQTGGFGMVTIASMEAERAVAMMRGEPTTLGPGDRTDTTLGAMGLVGVRGYTTVPSTVRGYQDRDAEEAIVEETPR